MMTTRGFRDALAVIAAGCLLALSACGDGGGNGEDTGTDEGDTATQDTMMPDTGTPDDTATPDDTGTEDTGTEDTGTEDTQTPDDTGQMDTGGSMDTSVPPDAGACTFFPDSCPDGQNCYLGQQGRQCAQYNSDKKEGDMCSGGNDCDEGLICNTQTSTCRTKCDPDNTQQYGCSGEKSCVPLADQQGNQLPFGICQPSCEMWPNDSCADGQNCYPTDMSGGKACLPYNSNKSTGDSCRGLNDCGKDLICIQGSCAAKCNDDNPCESGQCQMPSSLPFGVCVTQ